MVWKALLAEAYAPNTQDAPLSRALGLVSETWT